MAQFGQMEESLEQTQVVLLDVSARIGAVEGQNPADRDAVNRALAENAPAWQLWSCAPEFMAPSSGAA